MLRTYAPDIIFISASVRYETYYDTSLEGYSQEWYYSFIEDPNEETAKLFREETEKIKADCVVVYTENCGKWLEEMGIIITKQLIGDKTYWTIVHMKWLK